MATYIRYAHKAERLDKRLDEARDRLEIATRVVAVTILDKGTGVFTLTFIFYDGTELTLSEAEVANGDIFLWDIERLLLTNTAQVGLIVKLLIDIQL